MSAPSSHSFSLVVVLAVTWCIGGLSEGAQAEPPSHPAAARVTALARALRSSDETRDLVPRVAWLLITHADPRVRPQDHASPRSTTRRAIHHRNAEIRNETEHGMAVPCARIARRCCQRVSKSGTMFT